MFHSFLPNIFFHKDVVFRIRFYSIRFAIVRVKLILGFNTGSFLVFFNNFFFLLRIFTKIQKKTFKSNNKNNNYYTTKIHTQNNNKKEAIPTSLPKE